MLSETMSLTDRIDARRLEASRRLNLTVKAAQGQFLTPGPVAHFMASLFSPQAIGTVRLLDAGAGIGSLTAAFVDAALQRTLPGSSVAVTAYETDALLTSYLQQTVDDCATSCHDSGIAFEPHLVREDCIQAGAEQLSLGATPHLFTHALLNPPYKKIHSASLQRRLLRSIGVETGNLYAGFLAIAIKLLAPGGEQVAIIPRNFCNDPYFKPFRHLLLDAMAIRHIHIFDSRTHAFKEDVLQGNSILSAIKDAPQQAVTLSVSPDTDFAQLRRRVVDFTQFVNPPDDLTRSAMDIRGRGGSF